MEDYLNPYTEYGDYAQQTYDYQDKRRRYKGSTTVIINGREPYDISLNAGNKDRYSKGKPVIEFVYIKNKCCF